MLMHKTFSKAVEDEMRRLGYCEEADFCHMIRKWYDAEDAPGMCAEERIKYRLILKEFLLDGVDFGRYPVYRMYIKGFPKTMFESFFQRIDTMIQLYNIIPSGRYNSSAISSLVNETFFGELSELEPTRLGCPKAVSIPRLMTAVTEIQHYRSDPTQSTFKIVTCRKAVYPETELMTLTDDGCTSDRGERGRSDCSKVIPRNHAFDMASRRRRKPRKSKQSDVSKPTEVTRGCHKCDESKVLPTTRLGIELKDPHTV